jgi:hypothetical protein
VGEMVLSDKNVMALGAGMGVQYPYKAWFGAADIGAYDIHKDYDFDGAAPELYRLRLTGGRKILPYVSLFGGVSLNYFWRQDGDATVFPLGDYQAKVNGDLHVWPGLYAGLRLGV